MNNNIDICAYYALNLNEYKMDAHKHDMYEIMYATSGECTVYFEDEIIKLKRGEFIVIHPQVEHKLQIVNQSNCSVLNLEWVLGKGFINLNDAYNNSVFIKNFFKERFKYKKLYDEGQFGFALKDLIQVLGSTANDKYLIQVIFIRLLLEMSKAFENSSYYSSVKYINLAKKYIKENLSSDLNVELIATNAGISGYYLQSLFSKYLNSGVINYVNDLRIQKACYLLKNSNLSVMDIAFELGYNSRQHFSYTFEKRCKMSPQNYKKLYKQTLQPNTKTFKTIVLK